jgi:hypothetical protein
MKLLVAAGVLAALVQSQTPALRIVVLEGEGAVNIIQQKTAVRPLVEVRDRNNVPVAGATVTFTIGGGQPAAFAGGVQTLTVTTNAAGQAAAGGFNVLGPGAVQMQVQAAYQGQIATAAISQTNVATAAAAASLAGAAAGAVAGAGVGGGLSGATIGVIGAAVGGGALVATQVGGGGSDDNGVTAPVTTQTVTTTPASPPPSDVRFTGPFNGQIVVTTTSGTATCVSTRSINGTLAITLRDANSRGELQTTGTVQEVALTASALCTPLGGTPFNRGGDVTGGPSSLTFTFESSFTSTEPATVTATESVRFTGSVSGDSIIGTLVYTHTTRGIGQGGSVIAGNGSTSIPVTLR